MGLAAIMWQEYVYFKRKFGSITLGSMISPVLYLIAFGWGLGGAKHTHVPAKERKAGSEGMPKTLPR
ncbi:Hypothetical protein DEACI_0736 [Acididesulfobacillus acetoxydans]|uniref:Uncharacterized protein n=1 Tax=Acididesulfobacillus acetoxydans TaxID=1561005 RepID=A0A8S0XAL9_9FIRM|nr:hypothetical protein [Acididesulfobacillus acetoxydans]CAA7600086.1 Hypothetical protein DEACI_0736 [Acididesulfobacillus acetoxydans]CEJ07670.1 Hypothetical protein DEACI_2136 [Acididesulfobacillus acetoxydans]